MSGIGKKSRSSARISVSNVDVMSKADESRGHGKCSTSLIVIPHHTQEFHIQRAHNHAHTLKHIFNLCVSVLPHAALAKALKKARAIEAGNSKQTKDQHKIGRSTGAELGFLHLAPVSDSR